MQLTDLQWIVVVFQQGTTVVCREGPVKLTDNIINMLTVGSVKHTRQHHKTRDQSREVNTINATLYSTAYNAQKMCSATYARQLCIHALRPNYRCASLQCKGMRWSWRCDVSSRLDHRNSKMLQDVNAVVRECSTFWVYSYYSDNCCVWSMTLLPYTWFKLASYYHLHK